MGQRIFAGDLKFFGKGQGRFTKFLTDEEGACYFFSSLSQKRGGLLIFFLHLKKESFFRGFFLMKEDYPN